jgi:hypothetical protein
MPNISIRFRYNAGDVEGLETVVEDINPNVTTVKELIRKFCKQSSTPFCTDEDKISFLFNGKLINEKSFLDLYLSDKKIRLISSKHAILVKDMSHLIGQNIYEIFFLIKNY